MPLIVNRDAVLDIYKEADERKWVLPCFNAENLTTIEAILAATNEYGKAIGVPDLPIIIGITNKYPYRPQSVYYTHTRQWDLGLKLFLNDLNILTSKESPYTNLKVMVHLDHIQWDEDKELLNWGLQQFSSIMYDASILPLDQNIQKTAAFVEQHGNTIVIEGASDEIADSTENDSSDLTTPEMADEFYHKTGVDIIVANLGTEHRSAIATLSYHKELAHKIAECIGPRLCLHGTSSVPASQLTQLFNDGIRKVNIWTALERDSSAVLFKKMIDNAARIIGQFETKTLIENDFLGRNIDFNYNASINFYTTTYRQDIVFNFMKEIVANYLSIWYV
jgi:fructose/tagatose bisphosphate aldolase